MLPPRTPSQRFACSLRSGPSGKPNSGTTRLASRRARSSSQVAAFQVSGSRFSARMRRLKARPRDAIAIEPDDVASRARAQRLVADLRQQIAAILVPHMLDRNAKTWRPGGDHRADFAARAVIGNHDLEVLVALSRERAQHRG